MSEQVQQHVAQQVIVPAYVWQDDQQRQALLVHVGRGMARTGQQMRENIDVDQATVETHGMKATTAAAPIVPNGEPVTFVAFDHVPMEQADLVVVVVTAPVVPS